MITGQDIICVSYTRWHGVFVKSTVQLMSYLALHNRLIFVEYPFTIKDIITTLQGKQDAPVKKMLGLKPRLVPDKAFTGADIHILNGPPIVPYNFFSNDANFHRMLRLDAKILARSIRWAAKKLNFNQPIVINAYNPFAGLNMIGQLDEKMTVYYCYDAINDRRNKERGLIVENLFAGKANGVITTSKPLFEKKIKVNPNTFLVQNGVEYELFNSIADPERPVVNQPKKIGYIGSLDFRFDIEVVEYAIRQLPGYTFEFVGRNANSEVRKQLEKYPNTVFKPPVQPNEVPAIMYGCDVGLIPYTRIELNKNVYPLKINEYLAVGKPVVMTDFADIPEFEGLVSVASTKEEFLDKIKSELKNDTKEKMKKRMEHVKQNSWHHRAEEFANAITNIAKNNNIKL